MATAEIPVDPFNPGQVFACLGFLEAADILLGDAEGGFEWGGDRPARFRLKAGGKKNPFDVVLQFLVKAEIKRFGPMGYVDPPPKTSKGNAVEEESASDDDGEPRESAVELNISETFPASHGDKMALPIRISDGYRLVDLCHWSDGSGRETFKLYSGNRSAYQIALAMLQGVRNKPSKKQKQNGQPGDIKTKGIVQLWEESRAGLVREPLDITTPIGGSFNFDPRGAWTAIDAGYSPNDQKPKHAVEASPVVELLAALGLEHARPELSDDRKAGYSVWETLIHPMMARAALAGSIPNLPMRHFRFKLDLSGKNKIVTFAEEEFPT